MLPDIKDLFRHTNGFSSEKAKEDFEIRLKDIASFVISVAQKNIVEHSWSWLTIIENETETMLTELESYAHWGRY